MNQVPSKEIISVNFLSSGKTPPTHCFTPLKLDAAITTILSIMNSYKHYFFLEKNKPQKKTTPPHASNV